MAAENYSEELKIRLSPSQGVALAAVAKRTNSKPATVARAAVHKLLMAEDEEYRANYERENPEQSGLREVTYYSDESVEAGLTSGLSSNNPPSTRFIPKSIPFPVDFVAKIRGDSMTGIVEDGELAGFTKATKATTGQVVLAHVQGQMLLKMFEQQGNDAFLVSVNPRYDPIPFDEGVRIQGLFQGKIPA